jgi:integrase/recombinase XerC
MAMMNVGSKTEAARTVQLSLNQLLDEYSLSLGALNRSAKTVTWYLQILRSYFLFLASASLLKPIEQLGIQELRSYIVHLQHAGRWANKPNIRKAEGELSPYSVQGHVRAIKAFWSWLQKEGHIDNNPLAKLPLPKVPQKPVDVLPREQIMRLLSGVDTSTSIGARYHAIILLLLDSGIRISELVHIRFEDLDLQHSCVRVLGKGQKVRTVPFSSLTRKAIARYANRFRANLCAVESSYLFPAASGAPVSVNSVQQFLRRLAGKAGLGRVKCSPHIFRHTFATQAVANGANVLVLKEIMGHATLQTTMKYTHLQPHQLLQQHAKFSPVANLALGKNSARSTQ